MRKICFVITSHIHYARSKLILLELRNHPDIELQLVVGASAILPNYGNVLSLLQRDGFVVNEKITMTVEGGNAVAMSKTTGLGIIEFTTTFDNLKPDIVIIRGDRYEILAAAIAASYLNIPVAHIEGGDVSGTIDESVRHAVTKLSHIHFTTTDQATERVKRMGEHPDYIYNFGAPELELVTKDHFKVNNDFINTIGVGDVVDINKPFIIVIQHPVTTENNNRENIQETLDAIHELKVPTLWFWPNVDAGTDEISSGIRGFREKYDPAHIRFIKFLPVEEFLALLSKAACLVGNSSAGIKESSYFGVPVVNIGSRQNGRIRAENVIDVDYNKDPITSAIKKQIAIGKYPASKIYCKPNTAKNIVDTVARVKLYTQKKFMD